MECSICYEECKGQQKRLVCGHVFCTGCIKEWYFRSEEPACPMCRGPLYFRGFLSAGWSQEKEERTDDDELFQRMFDWVLHDRFEMFEELDVIPDKYDFNELICDLSEIQQTYNALKYKYEFDYDTIEYIMYEDYRPFSPREKYYYADEPQKPWFTKYPKYFLCKI